MSTSKCSNVVINHTQLVITDNHDVDGEVLFPVVVQVRLRTGSFNQINMTSYKSNCYVHTIFINHNKAKYCHLGQYNILTINISNTAWKSTWSCIGYCGQRRLCAKFAYDALHKLRNDFMGSTFGYREPVK